MKVKAILVFVFFSYLSFSQSPQKFTYQSIIKNSSGYLLKNQDVGLRISVLSNSSNGIEVYSEEHFPTSNSNGLVTLIIGEGLTNDNFSEIQWGDGEYFLKVEVDPEGGNSYIMNQTSQLLSVPYALYAGNSGSKLNLLGQDFITLQDQTLTINKVDLTDDVNGVLTIANGGTGSSTAPMVGVITAVDSPAARAVLGLGTAATSDSSAFATTAQGALADTALQDATAFATAAQGALADTALQDATAFATAAQGDTADAALPAANVSAFGGTLIDDVDALTARATLGLGTAALSNANDYLSLAGGTMSGDINLGANDITNAGTVTATTFGGALSGTIASTTTAITQTAGNNSTKVATTAYADAASTDDQTAAEVTSSATGNISATNVDSAIAELEAEKQTIGDVLDDFNALGVSSSDGEIIVATGSGSFAYESGSTARNSLGFISGTLTWSNKDSGSGATATFSVSGISATSIVTGAIKSGGNNTNIRTITPDSNEITFTLSGSPSNSAVIMYIVIN